MFLMERSGLDFGVKCFPKHFLPGRRLVLRFVLESHAQYQMAVSDCQIENLKSFVFR